DVAAGAPGFASGEVAADDEVGFVAQDERGVFGTVGSGLGGGDEGAGFVGGGHVLDIEVVGRAGDVDVGGGDAGRGRWRCAGAGRGGVWWVAGRCWIGRSSGGRGRWRWGAGRPGAGGGGGPGRVAVARSSGAKGASKMVPAARSMRRACSPWARPVSS